MKHLWPFLVLLVAQGIPARAEESLPAYKYPTGSPAQIINIQPVAGKFACTSVQTSESLRKDVVLKSSKIESHDEISVTVDEDAVNIQVTSKHNIGTASFTLSLDRNGDPSIKGANVDDLTAVQKWIIRSVASRFYPLARVMSGNRRLNHGRGIDVFDFPASDFAGAISSYGYFGIATNPYQQFLKGLAVPIGGRDPQPEIEQGGPNDGTLFELPGSDDYLYKVNTSFRFNCKPQKRYPATVCMDSAIGWVLIGLENGLPLDGDVLVTHFSVEPNGMRAFAASRIKESCRVR